MQRVKNKKRRRAIIELVCLFFYSFDHLMGEKEQWVFNLSDRCINLVALLMCHRGESGWCLIMYFILELQAFTFSHLYINQLLNSSLWALIALVCCPSTLSLVQWSHTLETHTRLVLQWFSFILLVSMKSMTMIIEWGCSSNFLLCSLYYIYMVKGNYIRNSSWLLCAPVCYKPKPIIYNTLGSRFVIYELSPVQLYWVFFANNLRVLPSIFGSWERERERESRG